ncbi:unnamed protein product [Owenia fusiformis]|uniref:Sushi domain-containing protein n=1 Tax=Owenia fusiformis TaxID=6347 RepID=A0A8S4MWG9_OWEFU|nr:unnamed protein product [Owenia fusiformis]
MGILVLYIFSVTILEQTGFVYSQTTEFEKNILRRHNELRALHVSTPPLKWHRQMAARALAYCKTLERDNSFAHSPSSSRQNPLAGENLWRTRSSVSLARTKNDMGNKASQQWYDEIKYYDYKTPAFSSKTGHFTQLVWDNSEFLGCGIAEGKHGMWFSYTVCCQYSPPGNYRGQFAQRVHPLKPKTTTTTTTTTTPRPETSDHVPSDPMNGEVEVGCRPNGVCKAIYKCDTCFGLSGPKKANCQSINLCDGSLRFCDPVGIEHKDENACVRKGTGNTCDKQLGCAFRCPQLKSPEHGSITPTTTVTGSSKAGTRATYACKTGYTLVGNKLRTCSREGIWSGDSAPSCVKVGDIDVEFDGKMTLCGDKSGKRTTLKIGQDAFMEVLLKYTFTNTNRENAKDLTYHVLMEGPCRILSNTKLATVPRATTTRPGTTSNEPNGDRQLSSVFLANEMISLVVLSLSLVILVGLGHAQRTPFERIILQSHNDLRALHENTPPFKWHRILAARALKHCKSLESTGRFAHSPSSSRQDPHAGENLWRSISVRSQANLMNNYMGKKAPQDWYNEIKYYDFKNPGFSSKTGHFTQIVWDNTKYLGCGLASGKRGNWHSYTVCCQYSPHGNYLKQFADRVHPLKIERTTTTTTTTTTMRPVTRTHVPSKPRNGDMTVDCPRSGVCTVKYTCDTCFKLSGPESASCQSSKLCDGSLRFCDPVGIDHKDENTCAQKRAGNTCDKIFGCAFRCPQLKSPENGYVTPFMTSMLSSKPRTRATYVCDTGFTLVGSKYRTCSSDGIWIGSRPSCVKANVVVAQFAAEMKVCGARNSKTNTVKIGQDAFIEVILKHAFINPSKSKTTEVVYHVLIDGPCRGLTDTKKVKIPKSTTTRLGITSDKPNGVPYETKFICSKRGKFTLEFSAWLSDQTTKIVQTCEIECV